MVLIASVPVHCLLFTSLDFYQKACLDSGKTGKQKQCYWTDLCKICQTRHATVSEAVSPDWPCKIMVIADLSNDVF